MNRWVSLALLLGCWEVEGARYRLGRFRCPSKDLNSPVIVSDSEGLIGKICEDITIELDDGGEEEENEEKDPVTNICLESSISPLPGPGVKMASFCKTLPVDMEVFDKEMRQLASICDSERCQNKCGTYYLIASLQADSGQTLWFESLSLRKECKDKPSLSLDVKLRTSTVVGNLRQGTKNPFNVIGIERVTIKNEVKNCTDSKTDAGGCGEQTDLSSRFTTDTPEVIAFFIPLNKWEVTGKGNLFSIITKL